MLYAKSPMNTLRSGLCVWQFALSPLWTDVVTSLNIKKAIGTKKKNSGLLENDAMLSPQCKAYGCTWDVHCRWIHRVHSVGGVCTRSTEQGQSHET